MEILKVGDIKECTIIGLDADRRRISLSLKSDAASRIGTTSGNPGGTGSAADGNSSRKVVKAVRPGSSRSGEQKDYTGNKNYPRSGNHSDRSRYDRNRSFSGSDDGMSYNPFATLLKNKK